MHYCDWVTTTPRLEPVDYVKKPQVVIRAISLLLCVIVFAVIHNNCTHLGRCVFNDEYSTCGFGMFLSTATFVWCLVFILLDMCVDNVSNYYTRKNIVLADFCLTGFWTFLWFVSFCVFCNRWQYTSDNALKDMDIGPAGARTVIAFTFFNLFALGILLYFSNLAYTAVKLLIADVNTFNEYPAPSPQNIYQGFTRDTDMLDVGQPAQGVYPPSGPQMFDTGPATTGGGLFPTKPTDAYQP